MTQEAEAEAEGKRKLSSGSEVEAEAEGKQKPFASTSLHLGQKIQFPSRNLLVFLHFSTPQDANKRLICIPRSGITFEPKPPWGPLWICILYVTAQIF